jgi:hypothetical protein
VKIAIITKPTIIVLIIVALVTAVPATNVNASGPALSDFRIGNQEHMCVFFGDQEDMKDLCDWLDICDDSGNVNSTHGFCTGKTVRNIPYEKGGGCPEGFHWVEDDETGLCYDNALGCKYDYLIFTNDKKGCIENDSCESGTSMSQTCVSKEFFCSIVGARELKYSHTGDYCFSNEDDCIRQMNGSKCDLPAYTSTELEGVEVGPISQYVNDRQIFCPNEPDHPFCNGKRGQHGYMFCEFRDKIPAKFGINCWDNNQFPDYDSRVYCAYNPETKEDCKIN